MTAGFVKLRIAHVEPLTSRVVAIGLESMAGLDLRAWEPGAHVELRLPSGRIRHYSLCGDHEDSHRYRIAVQREDDGRGGSTELHELAAVGTVVEVGAPRNNFALEPAAEYLFLAGGIGITPILSMLRHADGANVPWRLVYGGRSRDQMAFLDELRSFGGERISVRADDVEGRFEPEMVLATASNRTLIYACGPAPMLDRVAQACERTGRAADLRMERFSSAEVDTSGAPFEVELARSGKTLAVGPDESILQVLLADGITAPYSCENGYCGTCEAVVLDGVAEHRDTYLTDEERTDSFTMMICVSRCTGERIVLDL